MATAVVNSCDYKQTRGCRAAKALYRLQLILLRLSSEANNLKEGLQSPPSPALHRKTALNIKASSRGTGSHKADIFLSPCSKSYILSNMTTLKSHRALRTIVIRCHRAPLGGYARSFSVVVELPGDVTKNTPDCWYSATIIAYELCK